MPDYEVTIKTPNGELIWVVGECDDYHAAIAWALNQAIPHGGRVMYVAEARSEIQP